MNYLIGCDFHTRFQQIAMLDTETGELSERRLMHSGKELEEFYGPLGARAVVGIEATGYSIWFDELLDELGVELRVGDPSRIRAQQVRKKKTDREDALLLVRLLSEDRFPTIWVIDPEGRDLRLVLHHRFRLVGLRTRVKNALQAVALNHRLALGPKLFTRRGRKLFSKLGLRPFAAATSGDLWSLLERLDASIRDQEKIIAAAVKERPEALLLKTHPGVGDVTALGAVLILGPIERFPSGGHLSGYLGLVPAERSSGARRRLGRITKQGSCFLRHQMYQAAHSACRRLPEFRRTYHRILSRRGKPVAKTAMARRLCGRVYVMLREGIDYEQLIRRGHGAGRACSAP